MAEREMLTLLKGFQVYSAIIQFRLAEPHCRLADVVVQCDGRVVSLFFKASPLLRNVQHQAKFAACVYKENLTGHEMRGSRINCSV